WGSTTSMRVVTKTPAALLPLQLSIHRTAARATWFDALPPHAVTVAPQRPPERRRRCPPVFETDAGSIVHLGDVGSGQMAIWICSARTSGSSETLLRRRESASPHSLRTPSAPSSSWTKHREGSRISYARHVANFALVRGPACVVLPPTFA